MNIKKFLNLNSLSFGNRYLNNSNIKLLYLGHPHEDRGILDFINYLDNYDRFDLIIVGVLPNVIEKLRKKYYPLTNNLFLLL